ncbi:MAG TPA: endonuclease/exonuclease/phosphatase family protein [Bryobacteraceae bacterium]|nr:endonuclease/exonuclease/phosphatase family protein [Bryobacteraceae bacterium]
MSRFRIVTYNIHKCKGLDGKVRPSRIAAVLRAVDADVAALQEVVSIEGEVRELHQAEYLAHELGMRFAIGENRRHAGGAYGNVVLSRFPLESACNYDISVPGRERRGCLRTDIRLNGAVLHVFNVHLGTAFMERRHQGRKLLHEELLRSGALAGPRVVLGDFNEWTHGLASQLLTVEFQSADIRLHLPTRFTYPGVCPVLHLDHIYYDNTLVLDGVGLYRSRQALVASDHLPLYADFRFGD